MNNPAEAKQQGNILSIHNVTKSYHTGNITTSVLKGIDLEVKRGSFTVVLGASGSGKTTLLNLIGALDNPDQGTITIDDEDISKLNASERARYRREKIGFIFQFYNLLPTLTAQENIEVALELTDMPKKAMHERALEYLKLVGLSGKEYMYPAQLSGGEQQRVAVARALAKHPALILADEPTGNLDNAMGTQIIELMGTLQKTYNLSIIAVTHNEKVSDAAERVIHVINGVIVE